MKVTVYKNRERIGKYRIPDATTLDCLKAFFMSLYPDVHNRITFIVEK